MNRNFYRNQLFLSSLSISMQLREKLLMNVIQPTESSHNYLSLVVVLVSVLLVQLVKLA